MYNSLFWKDVAERALATMAQVLVSLWTVDGFDLLNLNVKATLAAVATAGLLSVLKAVVAANLTDDSVSPASLASDEAHSHNHPVG